MADFEILTGNDSQKWTEYLSMLPIEQQDVYFTPEYYSLYEANGDGSARCFVFKKDGDIAIYPFLLNRINDLGYDLDDDYYDIQGAYGYNGVVSSSYEQCFINSFYETFFGYTESQNIVCEFVRFHPILSNVTFTKAHYDVLFDRKTVCLPLFNTYESIWETQYTSNNRNMIRKAIASGMKCTVSPIHDNIDVFISIYEETMARVSAENEYLYGNDYFLGFARSLPTNSFLVLCSSNDGVEAASLFMTKGIYAHYHLSGRRSSSKYNFVTNMILDSAVKLAVELGCQYMHLGGGRSAALDDSLLKFKKNFSKETRDFCIGKKIHDQKVYPCIVNQWREEHPQSAAEYGHMLQGYRKLDA